MKTREEIEKKIEELTSKLFEINKLRSEEPSNEYLLDISRKIAAHKKHLQWVLNN